MKNILEEYIGMVLIILTIAGVVYYFRKQIFGDIAAAVAPTIQRYKTDIATIQGSSIADLAKDIYASVTDKKIPQTQFAADTAATDAALLAKGITPRRWAMLK